MKQSPSVPDPNDWDVNKHPILLELINAVRTATTYKIIRQKKLNEKTGNASSTNWLYIKHGTLPKPVCCGERSKGWVESEIDAVIAARIYASRTKRHVDMKAFVSLLVALQAKQENM